MLNRGYARFFMSFFLVWNPPSLCLNGSCKTRGHGQYESINYLLVYLTPDNGCSSIKIIWIQRTRSTASKAALEKVPDMLNWI